MVKNLTKVVSASVVVAALFAASTAQAACTDITRAQLQGAIDTISDANTAGSVEGGFGLPMWLTFVDESGIVCEVVTSGEKGSAVKASKDKWLGSRVISAQKANTANAFSLNGVSISSGALYAAVQPGGSLFGLQESNPVNAAIAYTGSAATFGTALDPLKGKRIGGVNVFGGGIAVYKANVKVGALGVSGDTSCTDHATVWKVRNSLGLEPTTLGADFEKLNITSTFAALGDHPDCANTAPITGLPAFGFAALP